MLFGFVTLVFFLSRLLPGDPASLFLSPNIPTSVATELRRQFGLDQSYMEQYLRWIIGVSHGDLGYSFIHNMPVKDVLLRVFPNTLVLGFSAFVLELLIAVSLIFLALLYKGGWFDRAVSTLTLITYSLPTFWVGILLLWILSYALQIFPPSQMHSAGPGQEGPLAASADLLHHLVLPALTIAIPGAAGFARILRTSVDFTLSQEYTLAAISMGLSRPRILSGYVLRNSLSSVVSLLGVELGILFTGVLVTETLFSWPGMGRLAVMAVFARDYPLLMGCCVLTGCIVVVGNLAADIVHALIDPRVLGTRAS
jgi:peptide/nickel transport system permease protein